MHHRANGTGTYRAVNATQAADFEETTQPDTSRDDVSNRALHHLMTKMNNRLTALAVSVAILAGSVLMVVAFLVWSRPG